MFSKRVNVIILHKNKKIKLLKKPYGEDDKFYYKNGEYKIIAEKIFMFKNKPTLLYFEGHSLPVSFDDIYIDKGEKKVILSADDIHKFASKRLLSVLASINADNTTMLILMFILILNIANIVIGLFR